MHQAWDFFLCYNKVKLSDGSPRASPESFFFATSSLHLTARFIPLTLFNSTSPCYTGNMKTNWSSTSTDMEQSKTFVCAYCGKEVCSERGYYESYPHHSKIYICHNCDKPTFFDATNKNAQYPGPKYGKAFTLPIPPEVNKLYEEARSAYSVNAFSAVGMCCRKLLMNICVNLGAKENQKFIDYVNYLDRENYIPKGSKKWVDIIRRKGNDATHEINFLTEQDAKQMIDFSAIIINLIYENDLAISANTTSATK